MKDLLESFGGFVVNIDAKGKPSEKVSEEIVVASFIRNIISSLIKRQC